MSYNPTSLSRETRCRRGDVQGLRVEAGQARGQGSTELVSSKKPRMKNSRMNWLVASLTVTVCRSLEVATSHTSAKWEARRVRWEDFLARRRGVFYEEEWLVVRG